MNISQLPVLKATKKEIKQETDLFLFKTFWATDYNSIKEISFYVKKEMLSQRLIELAWANFALDFCGSDFTQDAAWEASEELKNLNAFTWANIKMGEEDSEGTSFIQMGGPQELTSIEITYIDKERKVWETNFIDVGREKSTISDYTSYINKFYKDKDMDFMDDSTNIIRELIEGVRALDEKRAIEEQIGRGSEPTVEGKKLSDKKPNKTKGVIKV